MKKDQVFTKIKPTYILIMALLILCKLGSSPSQVVGAVELQNDMIKLQIVPEKGGRVLQYKLGDYSFFWVNKKLANTTHPETGLGPNGEWLNYGGEKLWPAPQGWDNDQQWPGPPDPILDGGAYVANIISEGDRPVGIHLTSQKDPRTGIQFSREIRIADGTTKISIDATMKNIDTKVRRWGIWSNTQLDASNRDGQGYNENFWTYCQLNPNSKFYKGYNVQYGVVNNPSFKPDYENGIMRVHYQHLVGKVGIDSPGGWIANVNATEGYVFVERFGYESDKEYPDGSSVEVWLNGIGEFVAWGKINKTPENPEEIPYCVESEVISPYATLQPGEDFTYHYDWFCTKIPPNSAVIQCSNVGITCKSLVAELENGQLTLRGKYGVFYRGYVRLRFFDNKKLEIKTCPLKIPVTPLQPLELSKLCPQITDKQVPHRADIVAILVYNEKEQYIGELARTQIIK